MLMLFVVFCCVYVLFVLMVLLFLVVCFGVFVVFVVLYDFGLVLVISVGVCLFIVLCVVDVVGFGWMDGNVIYYWFVYV